MRIFSKITLLATAFFALTACVNTAEMNQTAAGQYASVKQQASQKGLLDTTSNTAKRIHRVFNQMKPYAEKENTTGIPFNWEIIVIKSSELNAWAMAGGKMAFYTGLVDKLALTDDEIATVMGHEMAHALQEHSKADANRGVAVELLFGVTRAVVGDVSLGGVSGLDALKTYGVNNTFSRSAESEADEIGLYLMAKAGFNPRNAPTVWVKMNKATGGSGGWLSTHPSDENRQANLQKWLPKALEYYNARGK